MLGHVSVIWRAGLRVDAAHVIVVWTEILTLHLSDGFKIQTRLQSELIDCRQSQHLRWAMLWGFWSLLQLFMSPKNTFLHITVSQSEPGLCKQDHFFFCTLRLSWLGHFQLTFVHIHERQKLCAKGVNLHPVHFFSTVVEEVEKVLNNRFF